MSRTTRSRPVARMRSTASAVVLAGVLVAASACGGSTDAESADPAATQSTASQTPAQSSSEPSTESSAQAGEQSAETVEAQLVDFAIELDEDSFSAGTYEFAVSNEGDASHDFIVERDGEDVTGTSILQPGQSETLTVELEPGTYVFYCSVGNHRAMGMEITIEVT
ncbi:Copper binding protein, plastocyanin/azurin family [Blastococcus sp. DSM 46786]|uniref:cupredoxin domain-containing protein n=1 Tax=Blastococcus sp. DSM 46786 TaxID=1798227 RepID=UPI0008D6F1CA|nr:cupredoxin domain-containing protein [Blastococcus sp. DSM 46786]SEL02150.1 Copper binding protein, plastocyanin/azurin family [Blastococcus sp. DSM 46786]